MSESLAALFESFTNRAIEIGITPTRGVYIDWEDDGGDWEGRGVIRTPLASACYLGSAFIGMIGDLQLAFDEYRTGFDMLDELVRRFPILGVYVPHPEYPDTFSKRRLVNVLESLFEGYDYDFSDINHYFAEVEVEILRGDHGPIPEPN